MEEIIRQMREQARICMDLAKETREEYSEKSFWFWKIADLMATAADGLKRNIQMPIELEGGNTTYWNVCPECHGAIDIQDHFCRHCGQAVKK